MSLTITSPDFASGAEIPRRFTCSGEDRSPALAWSGVPQGTRSLALIVDDPDAPAGTWVHWVLYNLPGTHTSLDGNVEKKQELANGARQGVNDFRKTGYNGPCPPPGKPHRYYFRLYALDSALTLPAGADRKALDRAMVGHVLAHAEWMGRFQR